MPEKQPESDQQIDHDERMAIRMFDGHLTEAEARKMAREQVGNRAR